MNKNKSYSELDLKWKAEYNTGISEIDYQHQYFLSLVKRITDIITDTNNHIYCHRLFTELVYYARFHFYSEETIMINYNYGDVDNHKEMHMDLIDLLTNEINSMSDNMSDYQHFIYFLLKWFVRHTMEEDKKIAGCMK